MDVTELRVYKQSLSAFLLIEEIAKQLPKELSDVKRQILRCSKTLAPLIAEGFGRRISQKEFGRYTVQAMSSSDETITHLRTIALSKFNTVSINQLKEAADVYKSISKQLNKLFSSIKKSDL